MRTFSPKLLVIAAFLAHSFTLASTSSLSSLSGSGSSSISPELEAIVECNATQLSSAEEVLTTNEREKQCEDTLGLQSGTMLQVTTSEATKMCETTSCKAALKELYNVMPNCRYKLWGLQYSAKKLLEYCGITPTNSTDSNSTGSVSWSVTSGSSSFEAAGATDAPSADSKTNTDSSTKSGSSPTSAATAMWTVLVVSLIATFIA